MSVPIRADEPVLKGQQTYASITDKIGAIALQPNGLLWFVAFGCSLLLTLLFMAGIGELFTNGVGIWGINIPVAWGFALINYVWWIAIGMAGTFISGALYLTRQTWRSSLNRYAEAMTVFAVSVSGLFPIFHLGRPFFFYWVTFYPNRMALWPQWRSSLVWDFLAIVAYLLVSIMFWYVGMLPDLGTLRDQARTRGKQIFYGLLALGWRGEARHWKRFESLNLLLAGLAVPLVFSVHSMVALDFSEGAVPGWHSTMFPPFFVAGAFFSGFGMALALGIPMRHWLGLGDIITSRHLDNLAKLMLAAGLFVAYNYAVEFFMAFYSGDPYEITEAEDRLAGPYAWVFWTVVFCNVLTPQLLWSPRVRRNTKMLFVISLLVLVGMWFERFMLIINSLFRPYLPSSFGMFYPTVWDLIFLFGSVGLFLWMFTLFVRWLPIVATFEMRKLIHELKEPG